MNIDYEKLVLLEELLFKAEAAAGIYGQPFSHYDSPRKTTQKVEK